MGYNQLLDYVGDVNLKTANINSINKSTEPPLHPNKEAGSS
jgi:hypothetical protein